MTSTNSTNEGGASIGLALLRITLGVIVLVTWKENLDKDLYTADGLTGLINWLFDAENGNGSSLSGFKSFLDSVVVPNAGAFAVFQLVVELGIGIGLLLGLLTRFFSIAAAVFFLNLLLGYFGGGEWIWTYVLLLMAAVAVFLGYAGRTLGVDRWLASTRGESPFGLLW